MSGFKSTVPVPAGESDKGNKDTSNFNKNRNNSGADKTLSTKRTSNVVICIGE
jgi:hypothetical protein